MLAEPAAVQCHPRSPIPIRQWLIFVVMLTLGISGVALVALADARVAGVVYRDAAAVFGSAFAASVAGFAFSAICGAFLFHDGSAPTRAVQIMLTSSIAIQSLSVVALWRSIEWRSLRTFLFGGALGLPIGVFLLYHVSPGSYLRTMAIFLLGYGGYMLFRRPRVVTVGPRGAAVVDGVVGALGGITGGFAGFPGAFVTIWCSHRGWEKTRQRAVYQPFILIMQAAALVALNATAQLAGTRAPVFDIAALSYTPLALSGAYLGLHLFRRLSERQFTRILSFTLIASGIGLLGIF